MDLFGASVHIREAGLSWRVGVAVGCLGALLPVMPFLAEGSSADADEGMVEVDLDEGSLMLDCKSSCGGTGGNDILGHTSVLEGPRELASGVGGRHQSFPPKRISRFDCWIIGYLMLNMPWG